jgi:hypothetical protein
MVASATITTSSRSFFMAAMVAGDRVLFDVRGDRRRTVQRRCVAARPHVEALVRRPPGAF